jgi:pimeloyl-ACP methyl ester carboxylesterase
VSLERETVFEVPSRHGVLTVETCGTALGSPVFLLHGTPGSRNGPRPRSSVLYRHGLNLIAYDRPGYGGSARQVGRVVADAAADVKAIADYLEINHFAVVGRSGGGPHALACAALLPTRVDRVAAMVSLAPADAAGLDWFGGMVPGNVAGYQAGTDPPSLTESIRLKANRTLENPDSLLDALRAEMTYADRRVTSDFALRRLLAGSYVEALKTGPYGWIDDVLALRKDWAFDLDSITCPVQLWHGEIDNFAPVSHSRWLASRIKNAELLIQAGEAHFGAMEALLGTLAWAGTDHDDRGPNGIDPHDIDPDGDHDSDYDCAESWSPTLDIAPSARSRREPGQRGRRERSRLG